MPENDRDPVAAAVLSDMRQLEAALPAIRARAVAALTRIVDAIRRNPGTGQRKKLLRFLAGVYNGQDFPFDLTNLRGLDSNLADACLVYLTYDRIGERELHKLGVIEQDELHELLTEDGLYYEAQAHRLGRELYRAKFREGHPDEGTTA